MSSVLQLCCSCWLWSMQATSGNQSTLCAAACRQEGGLEHAAHTSSARPAVSEIFTGFSWPAPREEIRLLDAIANGRLSIQQLQQAENAALRALAADI